MSGFNKSATAPSTPKVQRNSNRNSLFFSQLRTSRMEPLPFELKDKESRPVTPNRRIIRQSMTPTRNRTQSLEVLNRRRRRSSMIVRETGEVVYAKDYRGPITMDYLKYVCTVLNQEQLKEKEVEERLERDKENVADVEESEEENKENEYEERKYEDKRYSSNTSPLRDLEINSKSVSASPGLFDQSLPIPDVNEFLKSPDSRRFEGGREEIFEIPVEADDIEIGVQPVVQPLVQPVAQPKQLSYLERILNLNNARANLSLGLDTVYPTAKRKLDSTFEIENRQDFTTVDTDWGKSLINLVDTPRVRQVLEDEPIINEQVETTDNQNAETSESIGHYPAETMQDNQITSMESVDNEPIDTMQDDNQVSIDNSSSNEYDEFGDDAMDFGPDLENEQLQDVESPASIPQEESTNTLATPDRSQEVGNSDTLIHGIAENRNSGVDESQLEQSNLEPDLAESHLSPPPSDLVNTEHSDLRTPEFSNLLDVNLNHTTSPNNIIGELSTPQVTENNITGDITPPRTTSGSPSGVIDEHYTLDNDQFAIFSEGSDSEDRDELEDQDTVKPLNILSDGYTSHLSRILLADSREKTNKQTGNVPLSFPTFKNLVKYVDIVNIESMGPARKKKKLARPSSDIYKLLWEKSDEFLSSLVSDLDAYAQHRSSGEEYQINAQDVILYLNKLNFKNEANQRVSQVYDISKLATSFLPLELLRSLDQNLQSIKPPPLRDGSDDEDE